MSTSAISSYLTTYNASSANSAASTEETENSLSMDDFITLLVAQLQNQDMNNTTDTSEMMAQMAQYSMVEAITEMNQQSQTASSFGLIGKGVTVTSTSDSGVQTTVSGVVDGVTLYNGETKLVVKGNSYTVDEVTEVFDASLLDT